MKEIHWGDQVASKKKARILRVLENNPRPLSPKEISKYTKLSIGTVKPYLRQMVVEDEIIQHDKGLYLSTSHRVQESGAITEPLTTHGIKIEHRYNPKKAPPFLRAAIPVTFETHLHRINHSLTTNLVFDNRKIRITLHEKAGLIEVFVNNTNSPYTLEDFRMWVAWLNGKFEMIPTGAWIIRQIGFNWDTSRIRLEGIKGISLQKFENIWIQLYQKTKNLVRIESHLTTEISLQEALEIMFDLADIMDRKIIAKL